MDKRKFLDAALPVIFLLTMSFYFLPRILHEIFGLAMAAGVIVHVFINRRRFFSMFKGKLTAKKIFSNAVNLFLIGIFITILITGICMSNYIFHDFISMELRRNMTFHQLHVALPYAMMILIGFHIGLHWRELSRWKDGEMERWKVFLAAVIIGAGIYGSFLNRVGDRILMKHIFATPATELSLPIFLLVILSTILLYAVIFIIAEKIFKLK